jgi:hypothetical protein
MRMSFKGYVCLACVLAFLSSEILSHPAYFCDADQKMEMKKIMLAPQEYQYEKPQKVVRMEELDEKGLRSSKMNELIGFGSDVVVGKKNSFLINEMRYMEEEIGNRVYYVVLDGPERVAGTICNLKNGTYIVTYTLGRPGIYGMTVFLESSSAAFTSFHKPLFDSPKAVYATSPELFCSTTRMMTSGRWVREQDDHLQHYNRVSKDQYSWQPYSECTILQPTQQMLTDVLRNKTMCWMGDSYARTLLAGLMYYTGRFDRDDLSNTEYPNATLFPDETWVVKGATMAMRYTPSAIEVFKECLPTADLVLVTTINLGELETINEVVKLALLVVDPSKIVIMSPHAWCGDIIVSKRNNPHLQILQHELSLLALALQVQFLDAFALTIARLDECTDGSHFVTVSNNRLTLFIWEAAILVQSVFMEVLQRAMNE